MTDNGSWVGTSAAPDTYLLVELLGGGGEGEVWRAELPLSRSGRSTVAVKIMRSVQDTEAPQRWMQFGHLLRSLSHPGLVRVTEVFTGPHMHRRGEADLASMAEYVVMDYIKGPTLREWCDDHPDATVSERLQKLRTVAAALDEMHSGARTGVPVAHGDVKPANIVVREGDAGTVLVDLGLARLTDGTGGHGRSTPYAAPELRAPGALATPEADRYAFAVTTAQVLTGEPPPTGVDGWTDVLALHSLLLASPTTKRRHPLVRQVMEAIIAPAEGRPRQLRLWLDSAADALSQVTDVGPLMSGHADPEPAAIGLSEGVGNSRIDTDTGAFAQTTPSARPRGPQSRALLLAAVALVVILVVGAGLVALTRGPATSTDGQAQPLSTLASSSPTSLPAASTASSAAPPTQRAGEVTGLEPEEGFDFDFDDRGGPEDRAGLDISGRSRQYSFDSLATDEGGLLKDTNNGGRLKRLPPRSTPYTEQDCDPSVPGWAKNVPGVPTGGSICVITSEGNTALFTVTKPWTGPDPQARTVSFTYRIWYA